MVTSAVLFKKGWNRQEVDFAEAILNRRRDHDVHFSKIVFWSALLLIVVLIVLVALVLIPLLVVLDQMTLSLTLTVVGVMIGGSALFLVKDIQHLPPGHHFVAGIVIPFVGAVVLSVVVLVANRLLAETGSPVLRPEIVGLLFGGSLLLPFLLRRVFANNE